jgi:hypothetical protein
MAGGQLRGVLALQRIREIQPFAFLSGVDEHDTDVGPATQVRKTQALAALHDQRCMAAAWDGFF